MVMKPDDRTIHIGEATVFKLLMTLADIVGDKRSFARPKASIRLASVDLLA